MVRTLDQRRSQIENGGPGRPGPFGLDQESQCIRPLRHSQQLIEELDDRKAAVLRADKLEAMNEQVLVELLGGKTAYDPEEWLPRVACPVLVFLGNPELGGVVDRKDRPRLRRLLQNASVIEFEDAGHSIPDRFVQELRAFLRSV